MALTKTSRYALRILGHMAREEKGTYSATDLHKDLDIPDKYLRRLLTNLSKSGFITSSHGRNGGYAFAKDTGSIRLSEIIDAVEGLESFNTCILGYEVCAFDGKCPMHLVWEDTRKTILNTLANTSLKDIYKVKTELY